LHLHLLQYSNTFSASFHFDDFSNIKQNPQIKNFSNLVDFSGSRYVGFLSFALNYHLGRLNVFGYHLVNLLIQKGEMRFKLFQQVALTKDIPEKKLRRGDWLLS